MATLHRSGETDVPSSAGNELIIIGAGPAGLSLGYELKQRSIPFAILEQGGGVGESWRRMPSTLKLVSPWKTNFLPGTKPGRWPRHFQQTRAQFLEYLQDYAREHRLPVLSGRKVSRVTKSFHNQFAVEAAGENFPCRLLVNATGYFSRPRVPEYPGAKSSSIPQIHVADYGDPDSLPRRFQFDARRILIVGHRLSAGQTLTELVQSGRPVALSHRSPLAFGSGPLGWWIFYRIFPWLEGARLAWSGGKAKSTPVRMQGGMARSLIETGQVVTFPAILRFEQDRVVFTDGQMLEPSLVIYATGFQPALDHLAPLFPHSEGGIPELQNMESVTVPGLFFVGLDQGRNFQSRFLRGIRKDVAYLAAILAQRWKERG